MIVLDTDHVSVLKYSEHPRAKHLADKLDARAVDDTVCLTIITIEEQMRGWLAAVAKERRSHRQVMAYHELQRLFEYFQLFQIIAFDESCADQFGELPRGQDPYWYDGSEDRRDGLGTWCPAFVRQFAQLERVPGLRVEDWLD